MVRIVAGRFGSGGGPPGTSGLSDDICVALDGVVNSMLGTPFPKVPEQFASASNAKNPPMLHQLCFSLRRVLRFGAVWLPAERPTASSGLNGRSRPLARRTGAARTLRAAVRLPPLEHASPIAPLSQRGHRGSIRRADSALCPQRYCWEQPDQPRRSRAPRPTRV